MASNSFVPDTVPVKGHSRKMPAKRDTARTSSFVEEEPGSASIPRPDFAPLEQQATEDHPETAFGQPIRQRRDFTRTAANLAGMAGSLLAPEVKMAGPMAGLVAKAPGFIQPVLNAAPSALNRAVFAAGGAAAVDPHEALPNAVASLAGEPLAGALSWAGRGAMGVALKAAPREAATAVREGIPATSGGVRKLFGKIGQVGNDIRAAVTRASRGGKLRLNPQGVAKEIEKRVQADLGKSSTIGAAELDKLADLRAQFEKNSGSALKLDQAHVFKQSAGAEASPQFVRLENGQQVQLPSDPVKQLWKLHESEVLNETLRKVVPEYEKLNARQSELIALKNVLAPDIPGRLGAGARFMQVATSPAARTIGGATAGAMLPAHSPGARVEHAMAGAALSNPAVLSYLALIANNPALLRLVGRSGQAVYGAVGQ